MNISEAAIGVRARFVGKDIPFRGLRERKLGTIVADAKLDEKGTNFGGGTCAWQLDGDPGVFITGLKDLEKI
jgi:hypothetical protein